MNTQHVLALKMLAISVNDPAAQAVLSSPRERQALYKALVDEPAQPYADVLRAAFKEEVRLRENLWENPESEDGEFYEGIYRCAYLLYRLADPKDIPTLWKAKFINMDVGTSLGAEFFIGPGLSESMAFLTESNEQVSAEIADYIREYFSQDGTVQWQRDWEQVQRDNILGV